MSGRHRPPPANQVRRNEDGERVSVKEIDHFVASLCADCARNPSRAVATTEYILQCVMETFFNDEGKPLLPNCVPFAMKQVPSIARVAAKQARLTTHILTAVATRPIVTIYELEQEVCFQENVETYAELGFGDGLHHLPIVQQVFQVRHSTPVYPVTSQHVMEFFLYEEASMAVLEGHGDTRDLMNAFSSYFERKLWLQDAPMRKTPRFARLPSHITNPRQLGVHIQSLPWLLTSLRQEAAQAQQRMQQWVAPLHQRHIINAPLYEAVARGLDDAIGHCQNSEVETSTGIHFDVTLPEETARATWCPTHLFTANAESGGLTLRCSLGPARTTTSESTMVARGTGSIPPTVASSAGPPLRRKGAVISEAPSAVPPVDDRVSPSLPGPLVGLPSPSGCSCSAPLEPRRPEAAKPSPVDVLTAYTQEETALLPQEALQALTALTGRRVRRQLVCAALEKLLAAALDDKLLDAALRRSAFLPLPHPHASSDVDMEVIAAARVADVCCHVPAAVGSMRPSTFPAPRRDTEYCLFHACVTGVYPATITTALERLGAPRDVTVEAFVLSCAVNRRLYTGADLNGYFTMQFLKLLEVTMVAVYEGYVKRLSSSLSTTMEDKPVAQVALDTMMTTVASQYGHSLMTTFLFPYRGAWRRGSDDMFFGGPHYFGLSEVYLKPIRSADETRKTGRHGTASSLPPLRLLGFFEGPHVAVQAFLRHCGARALEVAVTRQVCFTSIEHTPQTVTVHRSLEYVVPYVQGYLQRRLPSIYDMSYATLQRRLRTFRVVLGSNAEIVERLRVGGLLYGMRQTVRLLYLPQDNTFYGELGDYTAAILAEAAAEFFLPFATTADVRESLSEFLNDLMHCLSQHGDLLQGAHDVITQSAVAVITEAMDVVVRRHRVQRFALSSEDDEKAVSLPRRLTAPFTVGAAPPPRSQTVYPPGTDGFSQPNFNGPSQQQQQQPDSGRAEYGRPKTPRLPQATRNTPTPARLPQWDSDLFQGGYDVLETLMSGPTRRPPPQPPIKASPEKNSDSSGRATDEDEDAETFIGWSTAHVRRKRQRLDEVEAPTFVSADGVSTAGDTTPAATAAEAFVCDVLTQQYQQEDRGVRVVWVNADGEQGTPYDLMLVRSRGTGAGRSGDEIVAYIEVKSTSSSTRKDFELSLRELLFAARYGKAYKVYRVFGASTSALRRMRFQIYEDIVQLWYSGQLTLTGNVRALPSF